MNFKIILAIFTAAMLAVSFGCSDSGVDSKDNDDPVRSPANLTANELSLCSSANKFGLKLFREVLEAEDPGKNLFVSPLSVSVALAMTYNGADGDTRAAMHATLEFEDMSLEDMNRSYRDLIDVMVGADPEVKLTIANSIWYRKHLPVLEDFIMLNSTYFGALVRELDFNLATAADTVNAWVDANTNGLIKGIVEPPIPSYMVMYLINAIYFKGTWTESFEEEDTFDGEFTRSDGLVVPCRMMTQANDLDLFYNQEYAAVNLPYSDGSFNMMLILPEDGVDAGRIAADLNSERWDVLTDAMTKNEITIAMPRFRFDYKTSLVPALAAMGMDVAFTGDADFSKICAGLPLFISDVKHKSFVEVNEEGTEAAAVTSVEIGVVSIQPENLIFDRPFLFIIWEKSSKTILFMGRLAEPEYAEEG